MTFEVRPFEARTVSWWYRQRGEIDFDPPYQRKGPVWDRARQGFLIDSIINDFDIPKLYLADFTYFKSSLNIRGNRFAVIDGKQRLSALFGFLEDRVPLDADFVYRDDPERRYGGLTYSELREYAPDLTGKVDNFNLPVMSVISDEESAVQELFVRLNSGKPLTAAERRNAMSGAIPDLVRELLTSTFFEQCVAFSSAGAAYEQAAAKLLLLETVDGDIVDLKRSRLDELYQSGEAIYGSAHLKDAQANVFETLDLMSEHFVSRDPLLRTQGQLPVYYLLFRGGDVEVGVRNQIEVFHKLRNQVRTMEAGAELTSDVPPAFTSLFSSYTRYLRNPNDARSVFEMVELLKWFVHMLPQFHM